MSDFHRSVLLQEAIDGLKIQKGKRYIDATLGGGGHSLEIVKRGGVVLGIDQDEEALKYVEELGSKNHELKERLRFIRGNFAEIGKIARENGFEVVAGIIFDLGVSSHQLDYEKRGFSFLKEAPLDMRMDKNLTVTARDLINGLHKGELTQLFLKYGEEPFAKKIAESIIEGRVKDPINTTTQLAEIVSRSYPKKTKINPATKVFQALRIAVNDELVSLEIALPDALGLIEATGRICTISFHSLEDRIIKHKFQDWEENNLGKIITKKPIIPSLEEIRINPRSRSAKLRIIEKI